MAAIVKYDYGIHCDQFRVRIYNKYLIWRLIARIVEVITKLRSDHSEVIHLG